MSGSVILLCMTVVVGMTWALFTDTQTVSNHLRAGDLQITLKRTELIKTTLDEKGYLVTQPADTDTVNFTNPTDENVFGLITDKDGKVTEKIVPGSKFVATMEISNDISNSSTAYDYWIEVVLNVEGLTKEEISDLHLDEQLQITIDSELDTDPAPQTLDKGLAVGSEKAPIGTLTLGDSDSFTVTMEFLDVDSNNSARAQNLSVDLVVHAVQRTTALATP